ncbi:hypothetical protein BT67DRAFT_95508 [Trichocladium antarcticum]|uniref:Uncharacterized protein n=1 Tax=Trichocladium antarcticum TaxID=1450529 RepID=A0AAN6UQ33_9PEZI|nr:hypothetical protein BT67DRAFT_95508 [Trichocladium antarcticum]
MVRGATLFLTLAALLGPVCAQFITPITKRQLWRVGDVQTITYNTKFTNYTIALWQQAMAGGSATLGPIVFKTTDGPVREFDWQVQLYKFDLASSNIFFFWLKEGAASAQGKNGPNMSSAYFNMTDKALPSSSKKTAATTSTTTSAVPSTVASTESSTEPSTEPSASLSTQSSTREEQSAGPTPSGTHPATSDTPKSSGGLPVGVQAGIGAGVGVIALTCIACAVMWFRYLKKQQTMLADLQQRALQSPRDTPGELPGSSPAQKMQQVHTYPAEYHHSPPVEMGTEIIPVELGAPPPVEIGSSETQTWRRLV